MLLFSHGGVLPSAAATSPSEPSKDYSDSFNVGLKTDILLPRSSSTAVRQPEGDDASAALPVAPAITATSSSCSSVSVSSSNSGSQRRRKRNGGGSRSRSSSNISSHSFMSSTFCQKGSSTNSPHSRAFAGCRDTAVDARMGTESHAAAGPAARKPGEKGLSGLVSRIVAAAVSSRNKRACQQQLLLPCLLGDPFVCLNVDKRVGIAAGTLLGRLSLFYLPKPSAAATSQQQQQQQGPIRGEVLLPQAYSDDGVAMCWTDTTYLTAVIGAADLVQWKLPSLRCMGSEQLSLFASRSAFNSVTMNMRLLRRCRESGQLFLLYRHCSSDLAAMILFKLQQQPNSQDTFASSGAPLTEEKKQLQKAWACALAAGVCTLDEQQQQQQLQFTPTHSACLLGTGAACIMDLKEGSMYERYETQYFCRLWRSVEAANLTALDFNGDFVLCCSSDTAADTRWLLVVDARGASRLVEESHGYMEEYLVHRQAAPRRLQQACFSSRFFLVVAGDKAISVFDLRLSFFKYYASRARALGLCSSKSAAAADAAAAAFSCCAGSCDNYKGTDSPQQPHSATASGSGSTSRLLRRQAGLAASPEGWDSQRAEGPTATATAEATGATAKDSPLRSLPLLFLRCLQNSAALRQKGERKSKRLSSNLFWRLIGSVGAMKNKQVHSSTLDEPAAAAVAATASAKAAAGRSERHPSDSLKADSNAGAVDDELLVHGLDGDEAAEGAHPSTSRSKEPHHHQQQQHQQDVRYPFFLFEHTLLAFRVADAFFRFCSLLLQQQRQQQQRNNLYAEEAAAAGGMKPPDPSLDKPFVSIFRLYWGVLASCLSVCWMLAFLS
ncbi:hypothetical protein, conserved [Eimeria praecox]|uniref:Uncharacterized protein n=1 Tax=Eimeria praecox TaxID=51316 RepID=U6GJA8_9EIME|nr:hypothetical protein, conserved [Eimeria praecox]